MELYAVIHLPTFKGKNHIILPCLSNIIFMSVCDKIVKGISKVVLLFGIIFIFGAVFIFWIVFISGVVFIFGVAFIFVIFFISSPSMA